MMGMKKMDKIAEFLINKIGYTLSVIIFLFFPGIILVFVWDREMFMSMEIIRLVIFSMGISFLLFTVNLVFTFMILMLEQKTRKKSTDVTEVLILPMMLTCMEMISAIVIKLKNYTFSVLDFIEYITILYSILILMKLVIEIIYCIRCRIGKKK